MLWALFSYGSLNVFKRIFKFVKTKSKSLWFSDKLLEGIRCEVAWSVRVKGQSGSFVRWLVVLRAIAVRGQGGRFN